MLSEPLRGFGEKLKIDLYPLRELYLINIAHVAFLEGAYMLSTGMSLYRWYCSSVKRIWVTT